LFSELAKWCREELPELILGAGSILDPGTAALYVNNGANFVVGPVLNADVARICNRRKIAYVPGCGSVSEISQAEEYGVEICKVFPGSEVGGPGFVKNILAPMPWSLIMPTGGVERTRPSIEKWSGVAWSCGPTDCQNKSLPAILRRFGSGRSLQWIKSERMTST
jgi:2-dehydro-3-deoxyphosphogluconate aldolase/(4S)-4-hydroxy-2-oxoglutarate aldolase